MMGAVLAGLGVAVSVYVFWFKPFLWVPIGVMLGYTAIAVGSRRQGMWTIIVSLLILVLAILLRL